MSIVDDAVGRRDPAVPDRAAAGVAVVVRLAGLLGRLDRRAGDASRSSPVSSSAAAKMSFAGGAACATEGTRASAARAHSATNSFRSRGRPARPLRQHVHACRDPLSPPRPHEPGATVATSPRFPTRRVGVSPSLGRIKQQFCSGGRRLKGTPCLLLRSGRSRPRAGGFGRRDASAGSARSRTPANTPADAPISRSSSSTGVADLGHPVGVVGRVADQAVGQLGLAAQDGLGAGGLRHRGDARLRQRPDLRARVEARAVDVAVDPAVARRRARLDRRLEQRRADLGRERVAVDPVAARRGRRARRRTCRSTRRPGGSPGSAGRRRRSASRAARSGRRRRRP